MQKSRRANHTRLLAARVSGFATALIMAASFAAPAAFAASPTQLSGGGFHTCALMTGGTVRCWGWNMFGQLGDGSNTARSVPVAVRGLEGATQVSGGAMHSCALVAGGKVQCWGYNEFGELGNGSSTSTNVPVATTGITSATAVASGGYHSCALMPSGEVKCWGYNEDGELGDGTSTWSNTPVATSSLTGATQLSGGVYHSCALLTSGDVKCWGKNDRGQVGDSTTTNRLLPTAVSTISGASQIAAGDYHSCAVVAGGAIKCWGQNDRGQLGDRSTTGSSSPVSVYGITGATQVAGGSLHTCALVAAGAVKCWGYNAHGQLGNGSNAQSTSPVAVQGITGAVQITSGEYHSCALFPNGTVKCWGNDGEGELGDGTTKWANVPVQTLGMPSVLDIPVLGAAPLAFTKLRRAAISFNGLKGSTFACSVDGAEFKSCTSPLRLSGLVDGVHSLAVRQTKGGETSPSAELGWTVDNSAPAAPAFTGKPAALTNQNSAAFDLSAESGAALTCKLDAKPAVSCSTAPTFGSLTDGRHTLTIQQTDRAGNRGPAASYAWAIDTLPPKPPVITKSPARLTNQQVAAFTVTNPDRVTLTCSVDGGNFGACPSASGLSGILEGSHTLSARATDPAGNSADATWAWSVDLTAPALTGSSTDSKVKTRTQTTYQLSASSDSVRIEWSDAASAPSQTAKNVAANTSVFATNVVFKTTATIKWLRLQDKAGNWSQWFVG